MRLYRCRPARPRQDPHRGRADLRLRPADRANHARYPRPHPDEDSSEQIAAQLVNALASGSYVAINDGTNVFCGQGEADAAEESARARAIRRYVEAGGVPYHLRTPSASRVSSKAWNWSNPASSRSHAGGPTLAPSACQPR